MGGKKKKVCRNIPRWELDFKGTKNNCSQSVKLYTLYKFQAAFLNVGSFTGAVLPMPPLTEPPKVVSISDMGARSLQSSMGGYCQAQPVTRRRPFWIRADASWTVVRTQWPHPPGPTDLGHFQDRASWAVHQGRPSSGTVPHGAREGLWREFTYPRKGCFAVPFVFCGKIKMKFMEGS